MGSKHHIKILGKYMQMRKQKTEKIVSLFVVNAASLTYDPGGWCHADLCTQSPPTTTTSSMSQAK